MKVLFLDIDGVMNHEALFGKGIYAIDPIGEQHLILLKQIVDETGVEIVLSSSWRCCENARDKVSKSLSNMGMKFISTTPVFRASLERSLEIQDWLDNHPEVVEFAILDDDADANIEGHFFQTTFKEGLTKEIANSVIKYLGTK